MGQHYTLFEQGIVYLNPPFRGDYLHLSVRNIIRKQLHGYILVPKWPSASWYHLLLNNAQIITSNTKHQTYNK